MQHQKAALPPSLTLLLQGALAAQEESVNVGALKTDIPVDTPTVWPPARVHRSTPPVSGSPPRRSPACIPPPPWLHLNFIIGANKSAIYV